MSALRIVVALGLGAALAGAQAPERDVVLQAMKSELVRSAAKLQLGDLEKPYFIAYRIEDRDNHNASARLGALESSNSSRGRTLDVEVRVGDYELDNTNFLNPAFGAGGRPVSLTVDDNPREIRRELWLATDAAYKLAAESLSAKRAALQNITLDEKIPDFSRIEKPAQIVDRIDAGPGVDAPAAEGLVRQVSAVFRDSPALHDSEVSLSWSRMLVRYANSDGTTVIKERPLVVFIAQAATQAADGRALEDRIELYARDLAELPTVEDLAARSREMAARLTSLQTAETLDRYNGPVLFEGVAAAQIFSQVFAPNLLGRRVPIAGDERYARVAEAMASPFAEKIGGRVLPRFVALRDDATATELNGAPLMGFSVVDSEGTPSSATQLVERGILRTLLTNRTPLRGISENTANDRGGSPQPTNLFVDVENPLAEGNLREELLAEIRLRKLDFGVIVRAIGDPPQRGRGGRGGAGPQGGGGDGPGAGDAVAAFRLYPDGREAAIRNTRFADISAASFRDILAASESRSAYHLAFRGGQGFGGGGQGIPIVSFVVPDLLFEDLTLTTPRGEMPRPPVLAPPSASGR